MVFGKLQSQKQADALVAFFFLKEVMSFWLLYLAWKVGNVASGYDVTNPFAGTILV